MIKRTFDLVVAITAILILSPLFVTVAAAVWFFLGRPIFFTQERPGLHGSPFTIYKFRSMREPSSNANIERTDTQRLTRFGRFLRSSSLDELPELWNVVRGDMSLVGPRPLLMNYLPHYTERERRRHDVRPGITGLAQINGRNYLSWDERLEFDVEYVDRQSFVLDAKILWHTIFKVVMKDGIATDTSQSMLDLDDERKERHENQEY